MTAPGRPRPAILVADADDGARERTVRELRRRYGADYRIVAAATADAVAAAVEEIRSGGGELALALADQWMPGREGVELLADVALAYPRARRGLLVDFGAWGHPATARAILRAMAVAGIDYYVLKPWRSPDELFNRTIAEFLHEWSRQSPDGPREVVVAGPDGDQRAHAVRALLSRIGIPFVVWPPTHPELPSLLERAGMAALTDPVVGLHDGRALADPSDREIAAALGFVTHPPPGRHDVVIVGAGPAGLAAAVYAASDGLRTLVVERGTIGGQAGSSSLIRNYLGFPRGVSGGELATRAYQQAWVFGATMLLTHDATALDRDADGLVLTLGDGDRVRADAVVLATGVSYRRLRVPELERLVGAGVFYGASIPEAQALEGEDVFVLGGGNSAGQAAMHLSRYARRVTIVVRRTTLATSMSDYLIRQIDAAPNIDVAFGSEVVGGAGGGRLRELVIRGDDGTRTTHPAAGLFVLIGAHPHTDWLPAAITRDEWGYVLTGEDAMPAGAGLPPPSRHETAMPGVFTAGDARHGSMKRVGSAVGEGAAVVQEIHARRGPPGPSPA